MENSHKGINCDFCGQKEIIGTRYACLVCINYDLCKSCNSSKRYSSNHKSYHPVQVVKALPEEDRVFWCPYCNRKVYTVNELIKHCRRFHIEGGYAVRCPICLFSDQCYSQLLSVPLLEHLLDRHVKCSAKRFNGLPTVPEASTECSICIENLPSGAGTTYLQCAHGFHSGCIARWLEDNSNCPVCRTQVDWLYLAE